MDRSGPGGASGGSQEAEPTETLEQLREELRKAKHDHSMATGTIISLQRQLEIQESELRKIRSENEMLQKQLREEKDHFEAMSERFGGLTKEERKEERIAMINEENRSLKQVVTEQESQLAKQKELISDLEGTIKRLRLDLVTSHHHIQKQEQAQKEIQSKAEALEQKELQTRVVLEHMSSKFERYRSRIIQAAFSVEGSQHPPVELNDEQVLEELQRIANERMEVNQILKQRGFKVPLHSSDNQAATSAKRKSTPRIEKLP